MGLIYRHSLEPQSLISVKTFKFILRNINNYRDNCKFGDKYIKYLLAYNLLIHILMKEVYWNIQ